MPALGHTNSLRLDRSLDSLAGAAAGHNEVGNLVFQTLLDNQLDDRLGFGVLGAVGRAHGRGNVDAVVGRMSNDVVVVVEEGQL